MSRVVVMSLPPPGRRAALKQGAAAALFSFLLPLAPVAAQTPCADRLEAFNRAVDAAPDEKAQAGVDALVADPRCGGFVIPAQRRLAAARLARAQKLPAGADDPYYLALVMEADKPAVLWQAAATLAESAFARRGFAEAAKNFDRAIDIVGNETMTPKAPPRETIEGLFKRAAAARLLAVNMGQRLYAAAATRDGKLGGLYAPRVRGVEPRAVPMPITFDYRSANLTEQGRQAAAELARAIREQRPDAVRLVGHTDPRGGPDYNQKLSVERAQAVAAFLKENDVEVPVEPEGVGAREPLALDDMSGLSQEDVYALDRRVEWRRDAP